MPPARKPLQLSFTTGPMLKRWALLRTCGVCSKSFMVGFACHTCGIADYVERQRRAVLITNRCMTRGCTRVVGTDDGCCDIAHQRREQLQLRDLFLSAIHTEEAMTPGHHSAFYARQVAKMERALGASACD